MNSAQIAESALRIFALVWTLWKRTRTYTSGAVLELVQSARSTNSSTCPTGSFVSSLSIKLTVYIIITIYNRAWNQRTSKIIGESQCFDDIWLGGAKKGIMMFLRFCILCVIQFSVYCTWSCSYTKVDFFLKPAKW